MKKAKILATMIISFLLVISGCGGADEPKQETKEPTITNTTVSQQETEQSTGSIAESDASVVLDESVFSMCVEDIVIPVPEFVNGAPMVEAGQAGDTQMYVVYQPTDEDTLASYLKLCSMCGLQSYLMSEDDSATQYAILKPGTSYTGVVALDHADDFLYILTDMDIVGYEAAELEYMMEFYLQDIALPTELGTNAMPQFYASVNTMPYYQGIVGEISYVFDNASCWTEWYSEIEYKSLWQYMNDMLVCGFDIWLDMVKFDDNKMLVKSVIHFSNGDAEVIVVYDASDKEANVYYKPGVSYNLLDGDDYAKYIPQR